MQVGSSYETSPGLTRNMGFAALFLCVCIFDGYGVSLCFTKLEHPHTKLNEINVCFNFWKRGCSDNMLKSWMHSCTSCDDPNTKELTILLWHLLLRQISKHLRNGPWLPIRSSQVHDLCVPKGFRTPICSLIDIFRRQSQPCSPHSDSTPSSLCPQVPPCLQGCHISSGCTLFRQEPILPSMHGSRSGAKTQIHVPIKSVHGWKNIAEKSDNLNNLPICSCVHGQWLCLTMGETHFR